MKWTQRVHLSSCCSSQLSATATTYDSRQFINQAHPPRWATSLILLQHVSAIQKAQLTVCLYVSVSVYVLEFSLQIHSTIVLFLWTEAPAPAFGVRPTEAWLSELQCSFLSKTQCADLPQCWIFSFLYPWEGCGVRFRWWKVANVPRWPSFLFLLCASLISRGFGTAACTFIQRFDFMAGLAVTSTSLRAPPCLVHWEEFPRRRGFGRVRCAQVQTESSVPGEKRKYKDSFTDLVFINGCREAFGRVAGWQVSPLLPTFPMVFASQLGRKHPSLWWICDSGTVFVSLAGNCRFGYYVLNLGFTCGGYRVMTLNLWLRNSVSTELGGGLWGNGGSFTCFGEEPKCSRAASCGVESETLLSISFSAVAHLKASSALSEVVRFLRFKFKRMRFSATTFATWAVKWSNSLIGSSFLEYFCACYWPTILVSTDFLWWQRQLGVLPRMIL